MIKIVVTMNDNLGHERIAFSHQVGDACLSKTMIDGFDLYRKIHDKKAAGSKVLIINADGSQEEL